MVNLLDKYNAIFQYNISTIIFDLDDTIYSEIDYLTLAFSHIEKKIRDLNSNLQQESIEAFLTLTFMNEGRKNLFKKLVTQFNIKNFTLEEYLNILRNFHERNNIIQPDFVVKKFILENSNNYNFCIATNGNVLQQKNKFRLIDLPIKNDLFIIYCNELGEDKKKPSPAFIDVIQKKYNVVRNECLMIGDSDLDEAAANDGGIHFIFVQEFKKLLNKTK